MYSVSEALHPRIEVRGFDRCLFGGFSAFDTMAPAILQNVYMTPKQLPIDAQAVMGHFAYSTLTARYKRARLVTFLREPHVRLLSHFVYWRCQTDAALVDNGPLWSARVASARTSLRRFLENPQAACQTDNVALRMLVWPHAMIPDDDFIDPAHDRELLQIALCRLKSFDFVDIVERQRGAIAGLGNWLGIPLENKRLNETDDVPLELQTELYQELDEQTLRLLNARTRLDLRLWYFVARLTCGEAELEGLRAEALRHGVARLSRRLAPNKGAAQTSGEEFDWSNLAQRLTASELVTN